MLEIEPEHRFFLDLNISFRCCCFELALCLFLTFPDETVVFEIFLHVDILLLQSLILFDDALVMIKMLFFDTRLDRSDLILEKIDAFLLRLDLVVFSSN